jgi:DNA mismatch repair protein MutS
VNEEEIVLTPMMKQFLDLKAKHPDAVMLFRCGDFYETYSTDAIVASEILGITLTKRANGKGKTVEMAGFPHHALDTYLPKLIRAGKRVAICDQLEDPKLPKLPSNIRRLPRSKRISFGPKLFSNLST